MKIRLGKKNKKTEFTRMCIGEAIIALLEDREIDKIRVSSVIQKAGVSRMTFYNYYKSIPEALKDYVYIIVKLYMDELKEKKDIGGFLEYPHILHALYFFNQYQKYFVTLVDNHMNYILSDAINEFVEEHLSIILPYSKYEIYFYVGGLLNVFLQWQSCQEEHTAEEIAEAICNLYSPEKKEYPH